MGEIINLMFLKKRLTNAITSFVSLNFFNPRYLPSEIQSNDLIRLHIPLAAPW
jgi:hypothetical protein